MNTYWGLVRTGSSALGTATSGEKKEFRVLIDVAGPNTTQASCKSTEAVQGGTHGQQLTKVRGGNDGDEQTRKKQDAPVVPSLVAGTADSRADGSWYIVHPAYRGETTYV